MITLEAKLDQILPHRETDGIECDFFDYKPCNCRQRLIKQDILTAVTEWAEEALPAQDTESDDFNESEGFEDGLDRGFIRGFNEAVIRIESNLKSTLREKEAK